MWDCWKSKATLQKKSIVFSKMVDAFYYQEKYGGDINIVSEFAENVSEEDEVDETKYYVLHISDTKILKNGYRFIRELILQSHNFDMNTVYETLMKNDIEVYSVKTDALFNEDVLCMAFSLQICALHFLCRHKVVHCILFANIKVRIITYFTYCPLYCFVHCILEVMVI
jgi:hypothetical protein